jgi:hypothetical protein
MSMMLPLSIHSLRHRSYEIFLLLHIAGAIGVLVMLFYHVKIWDGDYNPWLWTCVGVWVRLAPLSKSKNARASVLVLVPLPRVPSYADWE